MTIETDKDARTWGMLCHLAALAGYVIPFGNIIGPLIVWQVKKDSHPYVDTQGKAALNFQISLTIYAIIAAMLIFAVIGIVLLPLVGLFGIIMVIIASVKANNGEGFSYPLSITFIH